MNLTLSNNKKQILGVDIGSRFVKAVLLSQKGKRFCIDAIASEAIYGEAFQEREIKDFDAVSHAIKKLRKSLQVNPKSVAMAVSGATVLTKVIDMDSGLSDVDLEAQIEIEADSLIPYPINEVYIDFEEIGACARKPGRSDVLLSVAHKNIVENRTLLCGEADYVLKVMDIEGYALGNAMLSLGQFQSDEVVFCLSIGAAQLQLTAIKDNQVIMSRELPYGTDALVNDMAMAYELPKNEVQKGLLSGDLPENWRDVMYPQFLSTLQMQINRILQLYVTTFNAEQPRKIYLCGGGATISGLSEDLAMDMQLEVEVFNPFEHCDSGKNVDLSEYKGAQFAIAAGLAWRSLNTCHI